MYLAGKYERLFPSLEALMHLARCCKQSVVDALDTLEDAGCITRIRRIKRVMTPLGFITKRKFCAAKGRRSLSRSSRKSGDVRLILPTGPAFQP